MKPRKPDRFERLVEKIIKSDEDVGYYAFCFPDDVITILRNEHAWMRRMIKKQYKSGADIGSVNYGYNQAVEFFLEQLAQRRK